MIVAPDTTALRHHIRGLKDSSRRIAFVPTMGNLHAGHLALVTQAQACADAVVVSIFVNPMQFAAHEDLDTYPRTLEADLAALESIGVDMVFTPTVTDVYPEGVEAHTAIHVPVLGEVLCGKERPGHFDGVCTVVYKLFEMVKPDVAVFGEKDLQQLLIIKKMVKDLNLAIHIQSGPTQRDDDGLALSSRNQYLTADERAIAPRLWETLQRCAAQFRSMAASETSSILHTARATLEQQGFAVDYLELRTLSTLTESECTSEDCALFVAARLGRTRLIDNIQITAI
jgi:pantoate--beta-alanine ligase